MKPRGAKPGNVSRGEKGDKAAGMRSTGARSGGPAKGVATPARATRPERAPAAPNTDRLAKRLAAELPCSRGDAERYIEGGWVTVDGKVQEEPGLRVGPSQAVSLLPGARLEEGRPVTVLVHKPAGMYADDQPGSALDLILPENLMPGDRSGQRYLKRMFNGLKLVTPLERAASGLVVYTQEYAVARKLVEEGRHVEQEYIAQVEGQLNEADLARMQRGMAYEGRAATPMKVSWQNENHLRFALKSPMPGFIEAMCEAAGLRLLALRRLRIGRLPMAGLAPGQWRYRLEYERF
ncbi:RNA pseudouridine synthase [Achromobacter spanius]|uniref:RNA pseudouridine synthase n=1 Tax=Achromobacter spanius TaxID=217203 RepID=UPI003820AF9E